MAQFNISTPEDYGAAIYEFAKLQTGQGENHEGLADFLNSEPLSPSAGSLSPIRSINTKEEPFLTIYDLYYHEDASTESKAPSTKVQEFQTPAQFSESSTRPNQPEHNQIVFLRGYPSAAWLKAIGAKYHLEPDFMAKHLDFLNPNASENLPHMGLPSLMTHVLELCITTIGSRDCEQRMYQQEEIDTMRKQDKTDMSLYLGDLIQGKFNVGNAIVRRYSTLDETYFAIEQKVSIHIQYEKERFIAFVWLDSGNSLDHSINGPWSRSSGQTRLYPIIVYSPMDALNPETTKSANLRLVKHQDWSKHAQTAALLHIGYGSKLQAENIEQGAMGILHEILLTSANSESRFLVQMDSSLRKTLSRVNEGIFDGFTDLTYIRKLLYRHIRQLQAALITLKSFEKVGRSIQQRPKEDKSLTVVTKTDRDVKDILEDFNQNLEYAKALDKQCQAGITILMSSASIEESRKAMLQQERIAKLTLLAFLFVPLSFTTSFFGMNVSQLNQQDTPIWAWILMAVPVLAITLLAYFSTVKQLTAPFMWLKQWLSRKT